MNLIISIIHIIWISIYNATLRLPLLSLTKKSSSCSSKSKTLRELFNLTSNLVSFVLNIHWNHKVLIRFKVLEVSVFVYIQKPSKNLTFSKEKTIEMLEFKSFKKKMWMFSNWSSSLNTLKACTFFVMEYITIRSRRRRISTNIIKVCNKPNFPDQKLSFWFAPTIRPPGLLFFFIFRS